jgi:hypothetical protein
MAIPTTVANRRKSNSPVPMLRVLVPVALGTLGVIWLGNHYGRSSASQSYAPFIAEIGARPGAVDGRVLFADSTGIRELSLVDGSRYPVVLREPKGRPMRSPALSPDGRTLVWIEEASPLESAVMRVDLSSPGAKPVEAYRAAAVGPIGFSADGRAFAFAAREGAPGTAGEIVLFDGGSPRTLAAGRAEVGPGTAMPPAFSPDGRALAFTALEGGIEIVDPATGAATARFAGVDPVYVDAATFGFEWGGLRYRTPLPPEIGAAAEVKSRRFEHAVSRERRRSPLAYSPSHEIAIFARPSGARHTFPFGAGASEVVELCLLDVPSARVAVLDPDFAGLGAISWSPAKP